MINYLLTQFYLFIFLMYLVAGLIKKKLRIDLRFVDKSNIF